MFSGYNVGGAPMSGKGPLYNKAAAAPRGYVSGRGRGAAGFQTRSDLGNVGDTTGASAILGWNSSSNVHANRHDLTPHEMQVREHKTDWERQARENNNTVNVNPWGASPTGYVAGAGRGASKMGATGNSAVQVGPVPPSGGAAAAPPQQNMNVTVDNGPQPLPSQPPQQQQQQPQRHGKQSQMKQMTSSAMHNNNTVDGQYDDDDNEADLIWAAIDEQMNNRKKKRKKNTTAGPEHSEDPRQRDRLKIQHQFRDCKSELATLKEEDWANIPDAMGDHSLKFKRRQEKKKNDVFTPISDSMIESRMGEGQVENKNKSMTAGHGAESSGYSTAATLNMSGIGAARGTVLGMSLDKMHAEGIQKNALSGLNTSVVDPSGYITRMSTLNAGGLPPGNNLGDIHKARLLLKSVRDTNPKHGPGWIASARVEEAAGKTLKARKLIQQGCDICPQFVDVWLEAARLHPQKVAKSILATGVRRLPAPFHIPLFLKAAELETSTAAKKSVIRKALEANPQSLQLWKYAIGLEETQDQACLLLEVAVEKVPSAVELWLALARLQSYTQAQATLNSARKALPSEKSIWIAASKLEESQLHFPRITKIIDKAFQALGKQDGVQISRKQWLDEAQDCEACGAPRTAEAIVFRAVGLGILEEDRFRTWSTDVKQVLGDTAAAAAGSATTTSNSNNRSGAGRSIVTARAILAHALKHFPTKRSLWMQAIELEKKYQEEEDPADHDTDNDDTTTTTTATTTTTTTTTTETTDDVVVAQDKNSISTSTNVEKKKNEGSVTAMDTTTTDGDGGGDNAESTIKKEANDDDTTIDNNTTTTNTTKAYTLNVALDGVLQAASERIPKVEVFWLLRAKEQWLSGNVDKARDILQQAFEMNPSSERVWLAAAKLEWSNDEVERARLLLRRALERAPSYRVYMKAAMFEREQGTAQGSSGSIQYNDYQDALQLIQEGIALYPKTAAKLYMMGGQIYSEDLPASLLLVKSSEDTDTSLLKKKKVYLDKARKMYQTGIEKCKANNKNNGTVILWILASRLEERAHTFLSLTNAADADTENKGQEEEEAVDADSPLAAAAAAGVTKARSLLELARLRHPRNDQLWLESIRLERRQQNLSSKGTTAGAGNAADSLMARALQDCPTSGLLLSEQIRHASRVEQKRKATLAIQRNPDSPLIISAVATLFASDRKTTKARKWYERSVVLNPDLGDAWAYYSLFEGEHGTPSQQQDIKDRCRKAEPKHGEVWQAVSKNITHVTEKIISKENPIGDILDLVALDIQARKKQHLLCTMLSNFQRRKGK